MSRKIDDRRAEHRARIFETLKSEPIGEFYEFQPSLLREELTRATLMRAVYSERQLHEVMVRFWSDHFNIDLSKGECKWLKPADDRDVIRPNAMGKFTDLLAAATKSQAMLTYLDGRENRVHKPGDKPNENHARELLELHTLGVNGGYSQNDVMEVARCLSGWRIGRELFQNGKVQFEPGLHDSGKKLVLGQAIPVRKGMDGRKDLDDVLRIVASHTSTARHIATKLCRRFIDDEPPSAAIDAVATRFSRSHGSITEVLRTLFHTEAFRSHRGSKFKQPMHLIASALRVKPMPAGRCSTFSLGWVTCHSNTPRRMATKMPQTPGRAPSFGAGILPPDLGAGKLRGHTQPLALGQAQWRLGQARGTHSQPQTKRGGTCRRRGIRQPGWPAPSQPRFSVELIAMKQTKAYLHGNGDLQKTLVVVFLRGGADGLALGSSGWR